MILELSGEFPVNLLCDAMGINRSSFYYWKKMLSNPAPRTRALIENIQLFQEYHLKYPSHGYRWLNAKIRLDKGIEMSDPYAHKCCKAAGIKSKAKHYKYKKPGAPFKIFPNLLMSEIQIDGPLQCIVSDMTAFWVKGIYYELTLYMDLWNNEILSHSLSSKRGDRMTYINGLENLLEIKKQHPEYQMILHSDQGWQYQHAEYQRLLAEHNITQSMSRKGNCMDNGAMENFFGRLKVEMFYGEHFQTVNEFINCLKEYIDYYNNERIVSKLKMSPVQFRTHSLES